MAMKPGFRCDFFLLTHGEPEKGPPRHSLLYESDAPSGRLVIAQPSPPLPPACVGREIQCTYVVRRSGRPARFGFRARILSFLGRYEIASRRQVPAILIEQLSRTCPFDVRQCFRIKPVPLGMLSLSLAGEGLRVIDLSLGGATINGGKVPQLRAGERVSLAMGIDGQQFRLDAEVVRTWRATGWEPGVVAPALAAVKFIALPAPCEHALGKKILSWERQRLAKEHPER